MGIWLKKQYINIAIKQSDNGVLLYNVAMMEPSNKIVSLSSYKAPRGKLVLVGGCFDLLHYGHLTFLKGAKNEGDALIVALEGDEFIQRRKNKKPVHTQRERAEILAALEIVDRVILLPYLAADKDYLSLVKTIRPAVIAVSEGDPQKMKKRKHAAQVGAKVVVVVPLISSFSSSRISSYAPISRD